MKLEVFTGFLQTRCADGSCCCISKRTAVIAISLISLAYSCIDRRLSRATAPRCALQAHVCCMKQIIHTMFQAANLMSLVGAAIESATLLKLYLWCTLAYILMSLAVAVLEFAMTLVLEGSLTVVPFVSEVALYFVMFRCLPMVDSYRRSLLE